MMKKITLIITLLIAFSYTYNPASAQGLKNCDMSITIISPLPNQEFDFEDSARLSFYIKNNGPDDIVTGDTIFMNVFGFPFPYPAPNDLIMGDSVIFNNIGTFWNIEEEDVPFEVCVEILNESSDFTDPDMSNNETCVDFIIKGSGDVGIDQLNASVEKLNLFPNPTIDIVSIPLDIKFSGSVNISIRDILGRVMYQHNYESSSNESIQIDLSEIQAGIYIVELNQGDNRSIGKLIIK